MALKPVTSMAFAGLACGGLLAALVGVGYLTEVVLGTVGPLASAIATWLVVTRQHTTAPDRLAGVMIKLFAVKLVSFAAYVSAVLLLVPIAGAAFAASFATQYIMLHVIETVYLRRLFAARGPADAC